MFKEPWRLPTASHKLRICWKKYQPAAGNPPDIPESRNSDVSLDSDSDAVISGRSSGLTIRCGWSMPADPFHCHR